MKKKIFIASLFGLSFCQFVSSLIFNSFTKASAESETVVVLEEMTKDNRQQMGWVVPAVILCLIAALGIGIAIYYYIRSKKR